MDNTIEVNGVTYVRQDANKGNRQVIVGDRGWIFAGDASRNEDGDTVLSRAVGVRRWEGVGFNGMIANPGNRVTLEKMTTDVIFPAGSIIFRVPVADDWGL